MQPEGLVSYYSQRQSPSCQDEGEGRGRERRPNGQKYFCRFWSSFRGHSAGYSGLDILLKGLCPKICITVLCNKELVSQESSTGEKENFDPVPRSEEPLFPSMSKLCVESEAVERHVDRCCCKEDDDRGTG